VFILWKWNSKLVYTLQIFTVHFNNFNSAINVSKYQLLKNSNFFTYQQATVRVPAVVPVAPFIKHWRSQYSDSLRAQRSGVRTRWGQNFPHPSRPAPRPTSGYRVSSLGVKRPRGGVEHPSPCSAEVKKRVELYLYSSSGPLCPVIGRTLHLPMSKAVCGLNVLYELNMTPYGCLKIPFHVTDGRTAWSVLLTRHLYSPVSRPAYVARASSVFKNVECWGKRCSCDKYRNHDRPVSF